MAANKKARARSATSVEIEARLRDAGDHLRAMMEHEQAAQVAQAASDEDGAAEARRLFSREHAAFIAATRTAKFYMAQACDASGQRAWLDARLAPTICEFYGALANQQLHDHAVALSQQYDIDIRFGFKVVHHYIGGPPDLVPDDDATNVIVPPKFCYNEADLEGAVAAAYRAEKTDASGKPRSVVALATDYHLALWQIFKNAERNGRLSAAAPPGHR